MSGSQEGVAVITEDEKVNEVMGVCQESISDGQDDETTQMVEREKNLLDSVQIHPNKKDEPHIRLGLEPHFYSPTREPDDLWEEKYPMNNTNHSSSLAISLKSAYKHYGRGKNKNPVLLGLDMEVEKGTIYGLLGPSGCGKTTLLKCILGKLRVDEGNVLVFGQEPGTPGCGVPGSRVGYMPQELALFGEFNIAETIRYFSRIFGMSYVKYKERMDFLMEFLDLPSRTRMLQKMSGGQQRRASLAVALLHEPELLILDEPTVGVDPLLRTSIWNHLRDLSSPLLGTTIVITTHYIEEARQAHKVGMMRFGKLLAESSPKSLLSRYEKDTLEDVFLDLCLQDGDMETTKARAHRRSRPPIVRPSLKSKASRNNTKLVSTTANDIDGDCNKVDGLLSGDHTEVIVMSTSSMKDNKVTKQDPNQQQEQIHKKSHLNGLVKFARGSNKVKPNRPTKKEWRQIGICNIDVKKVNACMIKTINRMKKRVGFLIYQFVLPAIQLSLFCLAIGQDPKELPVAIVNGEAFNQETCLEGTTFSLECPLSYDSYIPAPNEHMVNFTCRYLNFLDRQVVKPVFFDNYDTAIMAVENGEVWGVLSVSENFTQNLFDRIYDLMTVTNLKDIDMDLLQSSKIRIKMDVTNQHIAATLQFKFSQAFEAFMKQLVSSCGITEDVASLPLVFEDPVYGWNELTFTDFMAPGILLTIVHSTALGYSAMITIIERNEGLLDRTWIAGVNPGEFALAHFLVSLGINLLQIIVILIFMILIFNVPAMGSIVWTFLLTIIQGICGTTIGLVISAICETQQDATQIALGIFYPNLILSGIIWPVESMPTILRYISYCLPQTFACEAMRGILLRGWGITYMQVWRGYLVTMAWIVFTYALFKKIVMRQE